MKTKGTITLHILVVALFMVSIDVNMANAQSSDMSINGDNRVETLVDRMGKDKFIKTARENPAFLENLEIRLEGMRGVEMKTKAIVEEAKHELRLSESSKNMKKKMTDHKWLESVNWYESLSDESESDEVIHEERTHFMYAVDEEGNTSINRISQWLDGDWYPNYVSSSSIPADGLHASHKYYEDYTSTGWNDQYEYEYILDEMERIQIYSSYNVWVNEYGDIEIEHFRSNYTYDENGYRASITDQWREGDIWFNEWKREFDYDADGVLLQWADFRWLNNQWVLYRDIINSYNEDGFWDNQLVEYYDEETGDLVDKIKYELVNDSDGNIIEEYFYSWDFESESWAGPTTRWLYTYDNNGYNSETTTQGYNFDTEEWENYMRLVYTRNDDNFILSFSRSYWDFGSEEWIQSYGYENEYKEDNQRTKYTDTYYYEGEVDYSNTTEYEYDDDGDIIKSSYFYTHGETTYFEGYDEFNYVTEMPMETPFASISSLADRPDDQGGYIEISLDGYYVSSTDLYTKYWLVWVENGDKWENIHRSEYFEGVGSTATVPVYDTKPSDEEPDESNTFDFMVTIHGAGGAILGATNISTGYAEDNIAPAKVNSVTSSISETEELVTLSWNAVNDNDVDGYHVYLLDDEGNFSFEESQGFSSSTNIQIQRPEDQGNYEYLVVAKDKNSNYGTASDPVMVSFNTSNEFDGLPEEFDLSQNYPNPFNPSTSIKYEVPEQSHVKITVFNMLGQSVRELVNTSKSAGRYSVNFDASDLTSGMYVYRIEAGNFTQTKKMTLLK